jgi:hypothetical protein
VRLIGTMRAVLAGIAMGQWRMTESTFDYQDAMEWFASHPMRDSLKFSRQALELGECCFPGMIEVLAKGPIILHGQVAIVMSLNGAAVRPQGSTVADYKYLVTLPDGVTQVVKPTQITEADLIFDP